MNSASGHLGRRGLAYSVTWIGADVEGPGGSAPWRVEGSALGFCCSAGGEERLDCFASLAMTVGVARGEEGLDCFASLAMTIRVFIGRRVCQ